MGLPVKTSMCLGLLVLFGAFGRVLAQSGAPTFEVDPTWPKPLPENWVTGQVSGVCVDNQDHVFIVNRNNITAKEAEVSRQAPPFIELDTDGKVVNGFGDWETAPNTTHGCTIDHENNFWTAGNGDGIIQKYSHDGKLMMQIGKRGVIDSSDGTLKGRAHELQPTQFNMPSDIAVDPKNGDVLRSGRIWQQSYRCFQPRRRIPQAVGASGHKRRGRYGCWWCIHAGRTLRSSWQRRPRVCLRPAG